MLFETLKNVQLRVSFTNTSYEHYINFRNDFHDIVAALNKFKRLKIFKKIFDHLKKNFDNLFALYVNQFLMFQIVAIMNAKFNRVNTHINNNFIDQIRILKNLIQKSQLLSINNILNFFKQ